MVGAIGSKATRGIGNIAGSVVSSAAMTPFQPYTYTNFLGRTGDQYTIDTDGNAVKSSPTSALERGYKAYAESFAETFSEHLGEGILGDLINTPLKGVRKAIGKTGYKGNKVLNDFAARAMFNDPWVEFGEEMVNNIISPILVGEPEQIAENFSSENLWVTAGTVALMGGSFATLQAGGHTVSLASVSNQEKKSLNSIAGVRAKSAHW